MFSFDGHDFADDAIDAAELIEDENGATWHVPVGDGHYETTDEGLAMMRAARLEQADNCTA